VGWTVHGGFDTIDPSTGNPRMRSAFAKLLTSPRTAQSRPAARAADPATPPPLDVGWHESSYELMRGVDVIEFDASDAPLVMASMDDL
jgi:hypothetical protein